MSKLAAVITGGGRGIGRAISIRLARDRAVLLIGRTEASLVETTNIIRELGGIADYLVADVNNENIKDLVDDKLHRQDWDIASLILNAGIGKSSLVTDLSKDAFRSILETNVISALPLVQLSLAKMKLRESGTICFINSTLGLKGAPWDTAYATSKHAQIGFAKSLAMEYGKYGISVVPICPSFVESEMTDRTISGVAKRHGIDLQAAREKVASHSAQKRIIPAEEVAEVVSFVCSGMARSLSGNPIIMSGGN